MATPFSSISTTTLGPVQSSESPEIVSTTTTTTTTTFFAKQAQFQPELESLSKTHDVTTDIPSLGVPSGSDLEDILNASLREVELEENILNAALREVEQGKGSATAPNPLAGTVEKTLSKIANSQQSAAAASSTPSQDGIILQALVGILSAVEEYQTGCDSEMPELEKDPELERNRTLRACSEQIEESMKSINEFFEDLLIQPLRSLPTWIESDPNFINTYSPFSVSNLFQNKLPKLTVLTPFLNDELVKKWARNYPLCVAKLKENGLKAYIDQKAVTSKNSFLDSLKSTLSSAASTAASPFEALASSGFEALMKQMFQNQLRAQFTALITFDEKIIEWRDNPAAIISFIEQAERQPGYLDPFAMRHGCPGAYLLKTVIGIGLDPQDIDQWLELDIQCEQIMMSDPQLAPYLNTEPMDMMKNIISMIKSQAQAPSERQTEEILQLKEKAPTLFKELLAALEENPINRLMIEQKLLEHREVFCSARLLKSNRMQTKESSTHLDEVIDLYTTCCFKLVNAKFKHPSYNGYSAMSFLEYLGGHFFDLETHVPGATPIAASPSKPAPSVADQIKQDKAFFIDLLSQGNDKVEAWLKEKNGNDYLVRGKQNRAQFRELLKEVDRETLRDWSNVYDACVEKLGTEKLKHLLPQ
jgi:hypothetical protein